MVKFRRTLSVAVAVTFAPFLLAASSMPPKALGQIEASTDFCVRIDSQSADKYKEFGKVVIAGMSEKELKEVRESKDYKAAYDAMTGKLAKLPPDKALQGCQARQNAPTQNAPTK